ncbi:MAG: hypothetical protein NZ929_03005 [Aigarchaeota archaeon]|nr:hypothetical protein [Aigarchaeota archaeon]MCX8192586.1 hypothetical protein [Nitrososphaeria archaeon]MDW7985678.1 hypothetical protein [Nitrososphaerota archaeon]
MKITFSKGVGFGLTSGVITTLGIIIGLESGTQSKLAVMTGILVLALADSLSDAMGIHVSEEAEGEHTSEEILESTVSTLISKAVFTLSFLLPVLLLDPPNTIYASVGWGLALISFFSYYMAKKQNKKSSKIILEHLVLTIIVIVSAYYLGSFIRQLFT